MHEEDDRAPEAGQITETAPVMTVYPPRFCLTTWTGRR
jgi:hypothetical protein